ncbi:transcriptional repressor [bacterium]|nr:transcriptional repressor [bacterium]
MDNTNSRVTHRHSRQRDIVLEELCKLTSHPTVDELFLIVRERLPRISLATVYRNLELLAEQGVILKLELAGHQRRFDGWAAPHAHIRCEACGAVADVDVEPAQTPLGEVQQHTDYLVTGQHTEFAGQCPRCQATTATRTRPGAC